MNAPSSAPQWWRCLHDSEKTERIDALCEQGLAQAYRVAVLATPEQLISNLTVQENIALPHDWHNIDFHNIDLHNIDFHNTALTTEADLGTGTIRQCLQHCLRKDQSIDQFLHLQGAKLTSHQRRWVGIARALYLQANYVVIDDDEKNPFPFEDERLALIEKHLPKARLHWVSLRTPSNLPDHWLLTESGVNI